MPSFAADEVVPDDLVAVDPDGVQRQCDHDARPVLAGGAVHEHRSVACRDRPHRGDHRIRPAVQVAEVGADHGILVRQILLDQAGPRVDRARDQILRILHRRMQRAVLDPHRVDAAQRSGALQHHLHVGSQIDHHLEPMFVHEHAHVALGKALQVVAAQ